MSIETIANRIPKSRRWIQRGMQMRQKLAIRDDRVYLLGPVRWRVNPCEALDCLAQLLRLTLQVAGASDSTYEINISI
jgi:hypothetical protein